MPIQARFTNIGFNFVERVEQVSTAAMDANDSLGIAPAAHSFIFNLADITQINKIFMVSAELNWQTNKWNHQGTDNELYFTPGTIATLPHGFSLGLGVPIGLNSGADRYRVIAMLVYDTA